MTGLVVVETDNAPRPLANYSQGVVAEDMVFLAGQIASDYRTGIPGEARRRPRVRDVSDITEQTRYVLRNLQAVVDAAGSSLDAVAKGHVFLKDPADFAGMDVAWREFFPIPPPRTTVMIGGHGLLVPGTLVEIDLWAAARGDVPRGDLGSSPDAAIISPLASNGSARRLGPLIHCAGRMALNADGEISDRARVDPAFPFYAEPIERQTRVILDEYADLMATWGGHLSDTVFAQVYLTDLAEFDLFEEVWHEVFPDPPARVVLQAGGLLSDEALVEIELVAVHPEHRHEVSRYTVAEVPVPVGAPHVVAVGRYLLLSGLMAPPMETPMGGTAYLEHPVSRQTAALGEQLQRVLSSVGSAPERIVRVQCFMRDLEHFYRYDRVWRRILDPVPPRTTVQSGPQGFLDPEALLQVGVVAVTS